MPVLALAAQLAPRAARRASAASAATMLPRAMATRSIKSALARRPLASLSSTATLTSTPRTRPLLGPAPSFRVNLRPLPALARSVYTASADQELDVDADFAAADSTDPGPSLDPATAQALDIGQNRTPPPALLPVPPRPRLLRERDPSFQDLLDFVTPIDALDMATDTAALASGRPDAIAAVLARNPFFATLDDDLRLALAQAFEPVKHHAGTEVVVEGEVPDMFLIVVRGELKVVRNGEKKGVMRPFDFFGFKNLFGSGIRSACSLIPRHGSALLYQLHREKFTALLQSRPELTMALLPALASHVSDSTLDLPASNHAAGSKEGSTDGDSDPEPVEAGMLPADPARFKIKLFDAKPYQVKFFEEQNAQFGYDIEYIESKLSPETVHLCEGAHAVCLFVHDAVSRDVAETLVEMGIKLVAYRCAGFDACDLKACDDVGLSVVRVPSYSPAAIAEHAAAMMLGLNRKLSWASARVHTGDFSLDGLVGFDIKGKTIGVAGTGKIGACFVQIALGFGARVLCYDVYKNPALLADPRIQYVDLDVLLAESDIISLHMPLLPSTFHVINEATLAKMKRGVMILNTSRGPLIDTPALIEALKTGQVGACENHSDTPVVNDNIARLLAFQQNVIITAHQAYLTQEALREIALTTLRNVSEYHHGKRMKGLSNSVNSQLAPEVKHEAVKAAATPAVPAAEAHLTARVITVPAGPFMTTPKPEVVDDHHDRPPHLRVDVAARTNDVDTASLHTEDDFAVRPSKRAPVLHSSLASVFLFPFYCFPRQKVEDP
ncbi:hypothetical protein AMAG_05850 [Allomyces macrogynus ATCC 38327]|uniref:Cyclic nucleotide-binding domain-containing protein n=1 Tax=Allomyces macrogynus (strain ATCC 38327) TaxID=578462 RepID=A0A0L0SDH0_ALLM3|nr:hypothetical protein AMAG_05850 [Allomyces macrogynus ATCC 38327]|eukprot:KNE60464.1 hypothetical protein AMAG_05850 [Allomyces macrogynus ATCC 38327]